MYDCLIFLKPGSGYHAVRSETNDATEDVVDKYNTNHQLKTQLNLMNVWSVAFGCIIGWDSFVNPGKKFVPNSGVAGTTIAVMIDAVLIIFIALSYAYMILNT